MKASPKKPSFFKPIWPGFKQGINIPEDFLKYLKRHDQYEQAILRRADKEWRVKVNDGRLGDGWENFTEKNNLQEGDILVFKHEGDMEFDVTIFDSNNQCEIEEQQKAQNVEETCEKFKSKEVPTHKPLGRSHFVCTIRPYCFKYGYLCLPEKFVSDNNLTDKKYDLIIRDERQRSWNLRLNSLGSKRVVLDVGWPEFSAANDLKEGDCVMFEIVNNEEKPIWQFHKPPKSKLGELPQRQNFKDLTLEVVTHKSFEPPKFKSGGHPQRQNCEDRTLEVATHKSFDKANHNINSSPLAKAPISKLTEFHQRQDFKDRTLEVVTHKPFEPPNSKSRGLPQRQDSEDRKVVTLKPFDKPNHNIKSFSLAEPPNSKSRRLPQRQDSENRKVVTLKPFDKPNHNIKSFSLAEPPNSKSRGLPQRQDSEDREVVTLKPFDKSNYNIKSSSLVEPPKSKSGKLSQRHNSEDRTLEVVTHKSPETSKSKSERLPQKQKFEDQMLGVVTHKSFDKSSHNIKLSRHVSPLREVVAQKSYGHSHFVCTVGPHLLISDTLLIPKDFALANGFFNIKKRDLIVRDEKERSWDVILRAYSTCVLLKDGWDKICDANCLKEGDHIMFEVITDGNKPIWKLHGKISKEDASITQDDGLNNEVVCDGKQKRAMKQLNIITPTPTPLRSRNYSI
ncbi:B3 domain-containing protein REM17-like [Solanum dulcamara]|uniref:B3 domain-containing protein REM17-like n=1 Tax=Solanum dulcamara TaxID=45834 RepID=UPI00248621FB|nr:B3 domain-containing protein REM17-like [Solanum dulcamara]